MGGSRRAGTPAVEGSALREFDELLLLDRLHQTFLLLSQLAIPAYIEHFSGEPDKLAIVQYYAERLRVATDGEHSGLQGAAPISHDELLELDVPRVRMRAALGELRRGAGDIAERHLSVLGAQPHDELRRVDESRQASTARCLLYDPGLLLAHRRVRELKTGRAAPAVPANIVQALDEAHRSIRSLRDQPGERDLSLRKFLDRHRDSAWKLAWLYRCRGVELERNSLAARTCFLRAWAIGDALFPVAERGRLDHFDPVFLAELGDVYARLERFDLMLRYIYCDAGLPAQFELALPVVELARAAESVRLARADESSAAQAEQLLPETLSQILFDQPVVIQSGARPAEAFTGFPLGQTLKLGWFLVGAGGCLVCTAITWSIVRVARRSQRRAKLDL